MTYPPVIQFETRTLEVEAQARLFQEREAARADERDGERLRLTGRLPLGRSRYTPRTSLMRLTPRDCEQ